jgi:outer membrane murein-binding lipoprotein Lpp
MVKSNRLKQTKHKRQTKRKRQTNRKMRRQIGGNENKTYGQYANILKQGTSQTNVYIPGYEEICNMIKTFSNDSENIKKLNDGIRTKDTTPYNKCIYTDTTTTADTTTADTTTADTTTADTIIVLRKKDSMFSKNTSINCEPSEIWKLASHNFKIFIEILEWNPFLNIPTHIKLTEQVMSSGPIPMYVTPSYSMDLTFTNLEWWASQNWWPEVKSRLQTLPAQQPEQPDSSLAASAATGPLESAPQAQVESAETKVQRLEAEVQRLKAEVQRLQSEVTKLTETNRKFIERVSHQSAEIHNLTSQLGQSHR